MSDAKMSVAERKEELSASEIDFQGNHGRHPSMSVSESISQFAAAAPGANISSITRTRTPSISVSNALTPSTSTALVLRITSSEAEEKDKIAVSISAAPQPSVRNAIFEEKFDVEHGDLKQYPYVRTLFHHVFEAFEQSTVYEGKDRWKDTDVKRGTERENSIWEDYYRAKIVTLGGRTILNAEQAEHTSEQWSVIKQEIKNFWSENEAMQRFFLQFNGQGIYGAALETVMTTPKLIDMQFMQRYSWSPIGQINITKGSKPNTARVEAVSSVMHRRGGTIYPVAKQVMTYEVCVEPGVKPQVNLISIQHSIYSKQFFAKGYAPYLKDNRVTQWFNRINNDRRIRILGQIKPLLTPEKQSDLQTAWIDRIYQFSMFPGLLSRQVYEATLTTYDSLTGTLSPRDLAYFIVKAFQYGGDEDSLKKLADIKDLLTAYPGMDGHSIQMVVNLITAWKKTKELQQQIEKIATSSDLETKVDDIQMLEQWLKERDALEFKKDTNCTSPLDGFILQQMTSIINKYNSSSDIQKINKLMMVLANCYNTMPELREQLKKKVKEQLLTLDNVICKLYAEECNSMDIKALLDLKAKYPCEMLPAFAGFLDDQIASKIKRILEENSSKDIRYFFSLKEQLRKQFSGIQGHLKPIDDAVIKLVEAKVSAAQTQDVEGLLKLKEHLQKEFSQIQSEYLKPIDDVILKLVAAKVPLGGQEQKLEEVLKIRATLPSQMPSKFFRPIDDYIIKHITAWIQENAKQGNNIQFFLNEKDRLLQLGVPPQLLSPLDRHVNEQMDSEIATFTEINKKNGRGIIGLLAHAQEISNPTELEYFLSKVKENIRDLIAAVKNLEGEERVIRLLDFYKLFLNNKLFVDITGEIELHLGVAIQEIIDNYRNGIESDFHILFNIQNKVSAYPQLSAPIDTFINDIKNAIVSKSKWRAGQIVGAIICAALIVAAIVLSIVSAGIFDALVAIFAGSVWAAGIVGGFAGAVTLGGLVGFSAYAHSNQLTPEEASFLITVTPPQTQQEVAQQSQSTMVASDSNKLHSTKIGNWIVPAPQIPASTSSLASSGPIVISSVPVDSLSNTTLAVSAGPTTRRA